MFESPVLSRLAPLSVGVTRAAVVAATCPVMACAQTATVRVTHDDPDGIVQPEQSVRITTTIAWQAPGQFHALYSMQGDVIASPNRGESSGNVFPYSFTPSGNTFAVPGVPFGGSVTGVHLFYGDLSWVLFGQPPEPPWSFSTSLIVVEFDWTAPDDAGPVSFSWQPNATQPQPLVSASLWNPPVRTVTTSYVGTTLTVFPAPATLALLVIGTASRKSSLRRSR